LENRGVTIKYPKVDFLATIIFVTKSNQRKIQMIIFLYFSLVTMGSYWFNQSLARFLFS